MGHYFKVFLLYVYSSVLFLLLKIPSVRSKFKLNNIKDRVGNTLPSSMRVWFHAASVGEVEGISTLLDRSLHVFGSDSVVLTTTSETGREHAKTKFPNLHVYLAPIDTLWNVRTFLSQAKPSLLVINETELWPSLLSVADTIGIRVFMINARISDHSFSTYALFSSLLSFFWNSIDRVFAQSSVDKDRLEMIGLSTEKIRVVGSTKFKKEPSQRGNLSEILKERGRMLTFGSVREEEEGVVLKCILSLKDSHPSLRIVLAPRHPERFDVLSDTLNSLSISHVRRSRATDEEVRGCNFLLLDTLGELKDAYAASSLVFVGGTFQSVGGHNIVEPCEHGIPVVVGSSLNNVRAAYEVMDKYSVIWKVETENQLIKVICSILDEPELSSHVSSASRKVLDDLSGVNEVILEEIKKVA